MRHVNVKLDDADWKAFEALHKALEKRRRHPLSLSSTLRLVIQAGVEAQQAVMTKAAAAPIAPPAAPGERWDTHVAKKVMDAAQLVQERKSIYRRFEQRCDQRNLTPHDFIEQMAALDGNLKPEELHTWYLQGTLPADEDAGSRLVSAVSRWLEAGLAVPHTQQSPGLAPGQL